MITSPFLFAALFSSALALPTGLRAGATQVDSMEDDIYVSLFHKDHTATTLTAEEMTFFEDTSFRVLQDVGFASGSDENLELDSLEIHQLSGDEGLAENVNENGSGRKLYFALFEQVYNWNPDWRFRYVTHVHCRFCSNDDYYARNRALSTGTEVDFKALGDALCDALREGPYDAFKGLEQCAVTPAHA
eukprot:Nitzschia sp. Nitz4//scaffold149_size55946//586//1152//NITZ4_006584-RA/size55946-processed-gene-0.12-mRNA-1//1//CDS//3329536779//6488//frame0